MANGERGWTWADYDRFRREHCDPQHADMAKLIDSLQERLDRMESMIWRAVLGLGGLLIAALATGVTNLVILIAHK